MTYKTDTNKIPRGEQQLKHKMHLPAKFKQHTRASGKRAVAAMERDLQSKE